MKVHLFCVGFPGPPPGEGTGTLGLGGNPRPIVRRRGGGWRVIGVEGIDDCWPARSRCSLIREESGEVFEE